MCREAWPDDSRRKSHDFLKSAEEAGQALAADLASARLSAQVELAAACFGLRQTDAQRSLLAETLTGHERSLQIARNRYAAGIVGRTDMLQAETQLANAQADALGVERSRAQCEQAIAVLMGAGVGGVFDRAAWQRPTRERVNAASAAADRQKSALAASAIQDRVCISSPCC